VFENLRNAFSEAIDNFQRELDRDRLPESVSELLHWMEDEIVDVRVRVRSLEDERTKTISETESEVAAAATCRRRGVMAAEISDDETVRIAEEHAEKHDRRAEVLRKKVEVLAAEIELGEAEVEQMIAAFKEAKENRSALTARLGRARANETVRSVDTLFDEMDRMDELTSDQDVEMEAQREVDGALGHGSSDSPRNDRLGLTDEEADEALKELKRRMGR